MTDFDNDKYRKNVRKEKFESKKSKRDEYSEEHRFQRKKISHLKNKIREMEEEELWEDWENEIS